MSTRGKVRLSDYLVYGVVVSMLFVVRWTPEWIIYPLFDWLGRAYLVLSRRRREISLASLRIALPDLDERERRRIAGRACGQAFMVLCDVARTARMVGREDFGERFVGPGLANLVSNGRAAAPGKPIVFCSPHLGSWEAGGMGLVQHLDKVHIVARPLPNPLLHAWLVRNRSRLGQTIHPRRGGVRAALAALKAGESLVMLPDQNQRLRGLFVRVFGKLASCDRSQARLAQLAGAPIVLGAAIRQGRRFRFRVIEGDVFTVPSGTADDEQALIEATERLQRGIESLILRAPDQYFWVHNRYRTRPPDEAGDGTADEVERPGADEGSRSKRRHDETEDSPAA